jgi:Subtilase family
MGPLRVAARRRLPGSGQPQAGVLGLVVLCLTFWPATARAAVPVGVADTGTASNLGGNLSAGRNFLDNSADTTDWVWHGTFVAGLIQAEAQADASIVPLRICNLANVSNAVPPASCSSAALASAVTYAGQNAIPIVNDSIPFTSTNSALKAAIQNDPGVLVVAAAGNYTRNIDKSPVYPCSYHLANVICVTASGAGDVLWTKADWGQTVDIAAPGVSVSGRTPWTTQSLPANLSAGTNCELQYRFTGTATSTDPFTVTGTSAAGRTAVIAQWIGSISTYKTATYPFPGALQGQTGVAVSFSGGSVTTKNRHAMCQGPTTQPYTSSGGSFAAATVSGAAAVLVANCPSATTAEVKAAILGGAATDVTPAGKISGNRELSLSGAQAALPCS